MADTPHYEQYLEVLGLDRGVAVDLARALDDPYTVIYDRKEDRHFIVWDESKQEEVRA